MQAVIQEELSVIIPSRVKDPRVTDLTITQVEMSPDGSHATVYFTLFNGLDPDTDPMKIKTCIEGLASAKGFLRRHIATVLNTKYVPDLLFRQDKGFFNTQRVHELLKEIQQ